MPLELSRYTLAVAREGLDLDKAVEAGEGDGYDLHTVTILHADQLVAEQAGPRYGMGKLTEQPIAYATLWCWAGLRRMGIDVPEFPAFKPRILSMDEVKADPGPGEPVDPTTPGPGTG